MRNVAVLAGVAILSVIFVWIAPSGRGADGVEGISLLLAGAPVEAILKFAAAMVAAMMIGGLVGAIWNRLAGIVTMAGGLCAAAIAGGRIDGWLKSNDPSHLYFTWAGEALLWGVLIWGLGSSCMEIADALAGRPEGRSLAGATGGVDRRQSKDSKSPIGSGKRSMSVAVQGVWACGFMMVGGSMLIQMLVQTTEPWQVVCGLGLTFALTGLAAHQLFPQAKWIVILMGPIATGCGWYLVIAMMGQTTEQLLFDFYGGTFWHAGHALPIHYASAGVVGAALGIAWSRHLSIHGERATGVTEGS